MSIYGQRDGLLWSSLFSVQNEKEKKELLKKIKEYPTEGRAQYLAGEMLQSIRLIHQYNYQIWGTVLKAACEHVALKFMICDSDLAKDLLTEEELEKATLLYGRKQYNSKLLQKLLGYFSVLLSYKSLNGSLENLFTIPLLDEIQRAQENELDHTLGALKKTVDKVTAGVKSSCYYDAELSTHRYNEILDNSLNHFLLEKTNYNFNEANKRFSRLFDYNSIIKGDNRILQLALVNDEAFWSKHENFNVVVFLNEVLRLNDARHAQKLLSLIAENLQNNTNTRVVLEHNLPLYASRYDEFAKHLEEKAFLFAFKRLEPYCDISLLQGKVPLCYPMSKANPEFFKAGQKVWEHFIRNYNYPDSYKDVEKYLSDEVRRFVSGETREFYDIAVILDFAPFMYDTDGEERIFFAAYHPDGFSFDNIWNRVYLKAYATTLLSDDEQKQHYYLQRIFADLMKCIEKRIGICTAHQLDTPARDNHFENLKQLISTYGINVSDDHKHDYIIALLDRDTALLEEAETFPVLEQIGDAIYGLAVAELLFYDPDTENITKRFENLTRAEAQVLISKKQGFDKLYLQVGLPAKYIEYDSLFFNFETNEEEKLQALNKEKYLADSLEMIIGAIYRDAGVEKALGFAKRLLLTTFSEQLHDEVRPTKENKHNKDIDMDYWSRILPSPCSVMTDELRTLWGALNKVLLIASLGTDDKSKRSYITNSFGNTAIYEGASDYIVSWVFHDYLNNGLASVLDNYGDIIREHYTHK